MGSTGNTRAGAQYARKRIVQACLTCRARKSRCDGCRPRCGFCVGSDSDCSYPDNESFKLDMASLQILDRIGLMEQTILRRLEHPDVSPQNLASMTFFDQVEHPGPTSQLKHSQQLGDLWPNGDIVMSWKSLDDLLADHPAVLALRNFRRELKDCRNTPSHHLPIFPTSPTVLADMDAPGLGPDLKAHLNLLPLAIYSSPPAGQLPEQDTSLLSPLVAFHLRNYVIHIHSKSPILDLEQLRRLTSCAVMGLFDCHDPRIKSLPQGIGPADVAILLLALALGQMTSVNTPGEASMPQSGYVQLALPWLGLAAFAGTEPIKSIQAQLLLASHHMWTLRHWDAWCLVDSVAAGAEKLLSRHPDIIEDTLSHRVLWATAKMQLELAEECQVHRPSTRHSKLTQLISTTSLPRPPGESFKWPDVDPHLESDTWFCYLAETSSRRLVERIKAELYAGGAGKDPTSHLAALYPLACELERQVEEWMDSLPASFRQGPEDGDVLSPEDPASPNARSSTKAMMRTILRNRMRQLQMLVFRPFLALLAEHPPIASPSWDGAQASSHSSVLAGARKYLTYVITFLREQPDTVVRHYGSWLLARNVWTAALTLVVVINTPLNFFNLDKDVAMVGEGSDNSQSPMEDMDCSAAEYAGFSSAELLQAADRACSSLWQWRHESQSLGICAGILFSAVEETRRRRQDKSG